MKRARRRAGGCSKTPRRSATWRALTREQIARRCRSRHRRSPRRRRRAPSRRRVQRCNRSRARCCSPRPASLPAADAGRGGRTAASCTGPRCWASSSSTTWSARPPSTPGRARWRWPARRGRAGVAVGRRPRCATPQRRALGSSPRPAPSSRRCPAKRLDRQYGRLEERAGSAPLRATRLAMFASSRSAAGVAQPGEARPSSWDACARGARRARSQARQAARAEAPEAGAPEGRIAAAEERSERERDTVPGEEAPSAISIGTTLVGALFGRKLAQRHQHGARRQRGAQRSRAARERGRHRARRGGGRDLRAESRRWVRALERTGGARRAPAEPGCAAWRSRRANRISTWSACCSCGCRGPRRRRCRAALHAYEETDPRLARTPGRRCIGSNSLRSCAIAHAMARRAPRWRRASTPGLPSSLGQSPSCRTGARSPSCTPARERPRRRRADTRRTARGRGARRSRRARRAARGARPSSPA